MTMAGKARRRGPVMNEYRDQWERTMKITINGTETDYDDPTISYDDVAAFVAIEEGWHPPLPLLSITYSWKGDGDLRRDGIMAPNDKPIIPAPGMRFSAYHTGVA